MTEDDENLQDIPESGAVFTFGTSRFADNIPNRFWIRDDPVTYVACGDEHTAAITSSGRIFTFGSNDWGQLGHGAKRAYTKPTSIKAFKDIDAKVCLVACGKLHTLLGLTNATYFAFGNNGEGQLGLGDTEMRQKPEEILSLRGIHLSQLSAGGEHSAAVTSSGAVYVWGNNAEGQLGLGISTENTHNPETIPSEENFKQVSCEYHHTAFLTVTGEMYTCGESEHGKLGLSDTVVEPFVDKLQKVEVFSDDEIVSVSCGGTHTAAITSTGKLYTWGDGSSGQLGLGHDVTEMQQPTYVNQLMGIRIDQIQCGHSHTVAVSELRTAHVFGDGNSGKLAVDYTHTENSFVPIRLDKFKTFDVVSVACGGNHTIVVAKPLQQWQERETLLTKKGRRLKFEDVDHNHNNQQAQMLPPPPYMPDHMPTNQQNGNAVLETSHNYISARERRRQESSADELYSTPVTDSSQLNGYAKLLPPISPLRKQAIVSPEHFPNREELEKEAGIWEGNDTEHEETPAEENATNTQAEQIFSCNQYQKRPMSVVEARLVAEPKWLDQAHIS